MNRGIVKRIGIGVLVGIMCLVGMIWLLTQMLGNTPRYSYAGKPIRYWEENLKGHDATASNEAFAAVNSRVIPELTNSMFHDTNDSSARILLIDLLNNLPGVQIYFFPAGSRRAMAAQMIGELGPASKSAVPALITALKGPDAIVHEAAISALGEIHDDPEIVIPLLIGCLDDDRVNDQAALALAHYGNLAKAAVPKILPMLNAPDKDDQAAARVALERIAPEVLTNSYPAERR